MDVLMISPPSRSFCLFLSLSLSPGQKGQCAGEFYLGLIFSKQTRIGTLVMLWMGTKNKKNSQVNRVWQQRCRGACLLLFTQQRGL